MQILKEQFAEEKKVMGNNKSLLNKINIGLEFEFMVDPTKFKVEKYLPEISSSIKNNREIIVKYFKEQFSDYLTNNFKLKSEWKYHSTDDPTYFRFETDASLKREEEDRIDKFGVELVTPVLTFQQQIDVTTRILKFINDIGGYVNSSCGFHINLSNIDNLSTNYPLLFSFYDESFYQVNFRKLKVNDTNKYQFPMFTQQLALAMNEILKNINMWGIERETINPIKLFYTPIISSLSNNILDILDENLIILSKSKYASAHQKVFTKGKEEQNEIKIPGIEFRIVGNEYSDIKKLIKQIYYISSQYQISCYEPEEQKKLSTKKYAKILTRIVKNSEKIKIIDSLKDKNYLIIFDPANNKNNTPNWYINDKNVKIEETTIVSHTKIPTLITIKNNNTNYYIYLSDKLSLNIISYANSEFNFSVDKYYDDKTLTMIKRITTKYKEDIYDEVLLDIKGNIISQGTYEYTTHRVIFKKSFTRSPDNPDIIKRIKDKGGNDALLTLEYNNHGSIESEKFTPELYRKVKDLLFNDKDFNKLMYTGQLWETKDIVLQLFEYFQRKNLSLVYDTNKSNLNTYPTDKSPLLIDFYGDSTIIKTYINKNYSKEYAIKIKTGWEGEYYIYQIMAFIKKDSYFTVNIFENYNDINRIMNEDSIIREDIKSFKNIYTGIPITIYRYPEHPSIWSTSQLERNINPTTKLYSNNLKKLGASFKQPKIGYIIENIFNSIHTGNIKNVTDNETLLYNRFISPFNKDYMISHIFYPNGKLKRIVVRKQHGNSPFEVVLDKNEQGKYKITRGHI